MNTIQLRISGKVQGVWYRASAKEKARELGLVGEVWNEPNGDVGAYVRGDEDKVESFIAWCRHGPPLAQVVDVQVEPVSLQKEFQSFEIVRK